MRKIWVLVFLLAACNFKPHYSRPDMDVPCAYRFVPEENEPYANLAWWKQFEDPVLDELIEIALQNNQNLQVATARVLEFYAKYQVVFSQLLPQISASGFTDRLKLSDAIDFSPIPPGVSRVNTLSQLALSLSYEFDFWGKIRNATEAAKAEYLAQVDARSNTIITLVTSLAKAYVQLKQYDAQLRIASLTYQSRQESWRIAKLRFDAGLVSEMEVKQAESEAEGAQVAIVNFEELISIQEDLISVLIGTPPGPICRGTMLEVSKLPPFIPTGLPSDLLQNRPDICQAEQVMIAANARIGVARAQFFPSFSLLANRGQTSTQLNQFFKDSAAIFGLAFIGNQYIYTGGRLTGQLSEAEAQFAEVFHSYQQTVLTAFQEVSDALIAHQKSQERYEVQLKQSAALEEYLRLANLRYFNGQNDYLTVVDSEKNLFQVQLDTAATQADLYLTLIDVYKALGQGWDVDGCTENQAR